MRRVDTKRVLSRGVCSERSSVRRFRHDRLHDALSYEAFVIPKHLALALNAEPSG